MKGQLRIDSVWAFIVLDDDGTEGIPAISVGDRVYPLMGADLARVADMKPFAQRFAKQGKEVRLVHFSTRTVQEVYHPDGIVTKGNP